MNYDFDDLFYHILHKNYDEVDEILQNITKDDDVDYVVRVLYLTYPLRAEFRYWQTAYDVLLSNNMEFADQLTNKIVG